MGLLFVGKILVNRIDVLRRYNIPVPVIGGLFFASALAVLHTQADIHIRFDTELRGFLMLHKMRLFGRIGGIGRLSVN